MGRIAHLREAVQRLLGPLALDAARESGVIQRQRKFTPLSLARTFVLGFFQNPRATDEELAQMAVQCSAAVTPQAIEQRYTPRLAAFLEALFRRAVRVVVAGERPLAPLLERFTAVVVLDSTAIALPDDERDRFRGCGGREGVGQAALKLQTELDLKTGALAHIEVESGRDADSATSRQHVRRATGTLRITDLGYFCLAVFAAMTAAGEYFLSRLQFGVGVRLADGRAVDLLTWLSQRAGPWIEEPVRLGADQLACRLIAWRVPQEAANRRRQKLRASHRSKWNREPTAARLAWCDWTILVTNVPGALLNPTEATVLYRARWQVELLFKRWKSEGRVADGRGGSRERRMVGLWSRLLAVVVEQWTMASVGWGDASGSVVKWCRVIRRFAVRIVSALSRPIEWESLVRDLEAVLRKTCRRNPRSRPGTFELLRNGHETTSWNPCSEVISTSSTGFPGDWHGCLPADRRTHDETPIPIAS